MFLKNKNIIFKIRRSKVTDYAALINGIPQVNLLKISEECSSDKVYLYF